LVLEGLPLSGVRLIVSGTRSGSNESTAEPKGGTEHRCCT
jgi:hypothetical protein